MTASAQGIDARQLERRTRQIGRELLDRSRTLAPSILRAGWWDERVMQWSMSQPGLKNRLFRLVDVLPSLTSRADVLDHLRQYLAEDNSGQQCERARLSSRPCDRSLLARVLRLSSWLIGDEGSARGWLSGLTINRMIHRLARRFIAGETVAQALRAVRHLRQSHRTFSLDLLGEKVLSEREADEYAGEYIRLIRSLSKSALNWPPEPLIDFGPAGRPLPLVNLSIKLSSLYSQFDPLRRRRSADAVLGRLRPILLAARDAPGSGVFIHVDMEHREVRGLTLELFERVAVENDFAGWRNIGIVVQAYLRDSADDLGRVIRLARRRGTPLTVRLVKGAYWDYETAIAAQRGWPVPVFHHKHETDANYERLTEMLLAWADVIDPAFASHNVRSLAHALAIDELSDLSPGHAEFQMLYGMGEAIQAALVECGQRVRVYAPFGQLIPGMAYLIRRLLENTSNESFLRQSYVERADEERLLEDPKRDGETGGRGDGEREEEGARARGREGAREEAAKTQAFWNCSDTDFSLEDSRVDMRQAIERARAGLPRQYRPIVAGRECQGDREFERENPAEPSQAVARVWLAGQAEAEEAVAAADAAQPGWAGTPARDRAAILNRLGDLLAERRYDLAAVEVLETAKPWREADADISEAIDYCRYYASEAVELDEQVRRRDVPGERNVYRYLPRGVGLIVSPWNFPLAILTGMSTAAVAVGNAVILKPSENAMAVAGELARMAGQAGFPPGVFNYLPCPGSTVGDQLVRHAGIDFIAFTGSRQVGLHIYATAAANPGRRGPKHVVCEMGGKNAIIIDADADLDDAVRGVVESAFGYSGQKCSACSRAIVVADAYGRFLDRLVAAAGSVAIGPPADGENFMGPVISQAALAKIRDYIAVGKQEARCVLETDVSGLGQGYYVGPTIFAEVPPAARIAREEIFGPVLAVMRANDFDDAIRLANNVDFALTGGVYSRSPANLQRARKRFHVGNLYLNRKITGALVDRQPFGGFKFSGLGTKAGGPDYVKEFVVPQTVSESTLRHGFAPESGAR
jgi:RHH-type proline utilization regulon transcriptional repressor/proline dehydrogenase/delta 1-pyrroline-5-carboxylate dehydrogenase